MKIGFITSIFQNMQKMIALADTKANLSILIQTLLVGLIVSTSIISINIDKTQKINGLLPYFFIILFFIFIVSSVAGIYYSMQVYRARFSDFESTKHKGLIYFAQIINYSNAEEYLASINEIGEDGIIAEYSKQTYNLAFIANEKMQNVNRSILFLLINLIVATMLLVICAFTNFY